MSGKRLRILVQEDKDSGNQWPRWIQIHATVITDDTSDVMITDTLEAIEKKLKEWRRINRER